MVHNNVASHWLFQNGRLMLPDYTIMLSFWQLNRKCLTLKKMGFHDFVSLNSFWQDFKLQPCWLASITYSFRGIKYFKFIMLFCAFLLHYKKHWFFSTLQIQQLHKGWLRSGLLRKRKMAKIGLMRYKLWNMNSTLVVAQPLPGNDFY